MIRLALGFTVYAGGLTFFVYGLAQTISNGSCGVDEDGTSVGPPCPDGMGPLILLMVFGAFVAVFGAIAASWGRLSVGLALGAGAAVAVVAASFGDRATVPPGGGTVLESRNFARVLTALRRELGVDATLQSLNVGPESANAVARVGERLVHVDVDASGRSRSRPGERAEPAGLVPLDRLDAAVIDRVVGAAQGEAPPGARVTSLDIRPERVMFALDADGRELALDYGCDAVLTSRDIRPRRGVDAGAVGFEDLDPELVERMARETGKDLGDVQYVLLGLSGTEPPQLTLYLPEGSDPPYVMAPLRG